MEKNYTLKEQQPSQVFITWLIPAERIIHHFISPTLFWIHRDT